MAFRASETCQAFSTDPTHRGVSIEVEQKFMMSRGTHILEELGFVSVYNDNAMTDWYFDDRTFTLLRQDCWLRLRASGSVTDEISGGIWQLKVGNGSGSVATVYSEIEGSKAVAEFLTSKLNNFHGTLPKLPDDCRDIKVEVDTSNTTNQGKTELVAFARIGTCRSSWKLEDNQFGCIKVDLDSTDFGYAVGEVEIELKDQSLVSAARERIKDVVEALSEPSRTKGKPMGKLEFYLRHRRPDIHSICVDCGVV